MSNEVKGIVLKLKTLTAVTALALAGCNGGGSDDSGTGNVGGVEIPNTTENCLSLIPGERICLPESVSGKSGERIHIPLQGEVIEGMNFSWSVVEKDGVLSPIFLEGDDGAYVVLPRTSSNVTLQLDVEGRYGSEVGQMSVPVAVEGSETLILNGINLVNLNTDGYLDVEWMPAVNQQGVFASDVSYTLEVTRLVDGEPSDEVRPFHTTNLKETIDVALGEAYRLVLRVEDSNGVVTYSEHIDYVVPENKPEFQDVNVISNTATPNAANYQVGELFDFTGTLKIVREMEDGTHYFDDAMAHEIYKPEAPLKFTMRVKELQPEEIAAQQTFKARSGYSGSQQDMLNSFAVNLPVDAVRSGYRAVMQSASADEPTNKLCAKVDAGQVEGSICKTPATGVMCDVDAALSVDIDINVKCTLNGSLDFKLESKSKFPPIELFWPGTSISKSFGGNSYFPSVNLNIGTRLGVVTEIAYPLKVEMGFRASPVVKGNFYFKKTSWLPKFGGGVDTNLRGIFKPLGDEGWVKFDRPSTDSVTEMGVEMKVGAFPEIRINSFDLDAEMAAKLAVKNGIVGIEPVEKVGVPGVNVMPIYSVVEADVEASGVGSAGFDFGQIIPALDEKSTSVEFETRPYSLYDHPKTIYVEGLEKTQCVGSKIYTLEYPVEGIADYGTLSYGDRYGRGWQYDETLTFPRKPDLELESFRIVGPGASSIQSEHIGSSVTMLYEDVYFKPKQEATLVYKFRNPNSWLQRAFPIYAVDKYEFNQGDSKWPWICWGNEYKPKEKKFTHSMTLEDSVKMYD